MYVQKFNVNIKRNCSSLYIQSLNLNHDIFRHRVTPTSEHWRRNYKRQTTQLCSLVCLEKRDDRTYWSPLDVFTGLRLARNFHVSHMSDSTDDLTIEQARATQVMKIDQNQKALNEMHESVHDNVSTSRSKQILHQNKHSNIVQH